MSMRYVRKSLFWITVAIVTALTVRLSFWMSESAVPSAADARVSPQWPMSSPKTYKVLHVMSYHSPWEWTDQQFGGFKEALRGVPAEYKVVQMDAKRNSSEAWKQQKAAEAASLIASWGPDLVFTGDDEAQRYVTGRYIDAAIPFVFCAVNAEPQEYRFLDTRNITGVLERMHFVQTIRLLKELVPGVRTIALISDPGRMWTTMIRQLKEEERHLDGVKVVSYDILDTFEQYKETVLGYQEKVDALGFLGVFEYKDQAGKNVLLEDVMAWTVENSRLPDFAFWKDRVDKGTLCAVTVSGWAQGLAAGEIARGILVDGRRPSDFPMRATEKGVPVINLERARRLQIHPKANILLTAQVVEDIRRGTP